MMQNRQMTRLIGMLAALVLAACVDAARDNEVVLGGGIGGTGVSTWEGGIGGTGVVGTITGFGSIIVNGLHIQYEADQVVESAMGPMTGANFVIGQVVAAETQSQNGRLMAVRLIAQTPLAGPVESVNLAAGEIRVLGETVHIMPNAELGVGSLENLRIGEGVVISGHRGEDGVYASRVDPISLGIGAALAGTITAKTNTSVVIDNRHEVSIPNVTKTRLTVGDYVNVSDFMTSSGGGLMARTATRSYGPLFDGRVAHMSVEGVFPSAARGVAGIGPVKGVPTGRAVVFVTKDKKGEFVLDGATQRPAKVWRQNLSIKMQNPDVMGGRMGGGGMGGGGMGGGGMGGGGMGGGGMGGGGM